MIPLTLFAYAMIFVGYYAGRWHGAWIEERSFE